MSNRSFLHHLPSFGAALLASFAFGAGARAQVTTAQVPLGGPGGYSTADGCQQTNDPPLLDDGTVGTGMLTFRYDQATHQLTVTVDNTSPVTAGVDNPLITQIYFNIPANTIDAVGGIVLDNQSGQGPAEPTYGVILNPSRVGCLGDFVIELCNNVNDPTDIRGGIANPAADSHGAPPNSWVNSPAVFEFTLTGPGANNLNANAIANCFAQNSGAGVQVTAAAHFQAGAQGGSAKISGGGGCRASIYAEGDVVIGSGVTICVGSAGGCHGCLFGSFNGTPFLFGNVLVTIGMPFEFVLTLPLFQTSNSHCFRARIPDDPNLVGVPFYMAVGQFDGQLNLEFSPQFVLSFQPKP